MAVPKRKVSRARRGKRRAHDAIKPRSLSSCPQCMEPKLPHRACRSCGTYKGKNFLESEEF